MSAAPAMAKLIRQLQALEQQTVSRMADAAIDDVVPIFHQRMELLRQLADAVVLLPEQDRSGPLAELQHHAQQLDQDIQPLPLILQQVRDALSQLSKNNRAASAYGETKTLRS